MAKKTVVTLVDDLDGSTIDGDSGSTVTFSVEGRAYEIDLSDANAAALRAALQPFTDAARVIRTDRAASRPRQAKRDVSSIREWAKREGHDVNERGRIPAAVMEAYAASH